MNIKGKGFNMYNFAIIDNSSTDIKIMKNKIDSTFLDTLKYRCDTYLDSQEFPYDKYYDVIFLDIEMPNVNGFELAKKINYSTKIIFMTHHDNLVTLTFDYKPFHFIEKNNFEKSSNHVLKILKENLSSHMIKLTNQNNNTAVINIYNINYIQIVDGITTVYTFDNKPYTTWRSLSSLYNELNSALFVKISQSVIVNMNYIEKSDDNYKFLILKNNIKLPISSRGKSLFKKKYINYLLK